MTGKVLPGVAIDEPMGPRSPATGRPTGADDDRDRRQAVGADTSPACVTSPPTVTSGRQPPVWTPDAIRALGATTDLPTAGQILGLSRNHSYDLARRGQFPVPVLRIGSRLRVATTHLITFLGIPA
jgi:hypothetical protein